MDTIRLEYFLRVVELGSINRAAGDLHLSQPALSRQLQLLEADLGAALLVRGPAGVRVTEAGSLLHDRARGLLRDVAMLREQVSGVSRGQVAVGFPHSWRHIAATRLAAQLIESRFIEARVNEATGHDLRRQLEQGLVDICVAADDGRDVDGYQRIPIARDPLVAVGAYASALNPSSPITVGEVARLPLILLARPNQMRTELEQVLADRNVDLDVVFETDSLAVCLDLVARGKGNTVLPACSLVGGVGDSHTWAPIEGLATTWAIFINARRLHSEAVRHSVTRVLRNTEEVIASGSWTGATFLAESGAGASHVQHQPG